MPIDRRAFLMGVGAAAVACGTEDADTDLPPEPAPVRDPGPEPFEPSAPEDTDVFPWAIHVGDPRPDGAILVIRANAPTVEAVFARYVDGSWSEAGRLPSRQTDGWTHVVELSGLDTDTPYAIWAEVDGVRSRVTRFRTAPPAGAPRQIRFLATSCFGGNGTLANTAFMGDYDADAILLLGDTIYADGSVTRDDYVSAWDGHLARGPLVDVFQVAAVVATWDDHEVENNWATTEGADAFGTVIPPAQLVTATEVWREVIPMRLGEGGSGVWRTLRYGDAVELFVLDCRGERGPDRILSPEQLDWLIEGLQSSDAHFKVVLTSVHITDHFELIGVIQDVDRWQGYPEQRATLVSAAATIPGVVFVTGDMHYGAVQRLDPEGGPGAALCEIAAGPAGSRLFPVTDLAAVGGGTVPAQYETLVETYSFCVLDFDPGLSTVRVRFVGDDGSVLAEHTLEA